MVALVEHATLGHVAVHCTYLRADGRGKANLPKEWQRASFGPVGGGAVRFGMPAAGEWTAAGEGIETTLSVAIACAMPAWSALSSGGMCALVLPRDATAVMICVDNDANGVGQRAAAKAERRFLAEERRVRVAIPPKPYKDFNDLLLGGPPSIKEQQHDVA
jgi:putative DNA primase/helicase